jgi:hypothetical protein
MDEGYLIALYAFYRAVNGFVILLFTAIEAFINFNIRKNYGYIVDSERRKEIYNKGKILLLPFKDKIGSIMKDIFKKDFKHSYGMKYQHINNLKEMRDNIVHLKPEKNITSYVYLYKGGLDF